MPMMDFVCNICGETDEIFMHTTESKTQRPLCPECGVKMSQIHVGAPAVVWARPMSYYNDKKLAGADQDSHIAYKVRSTTRKDGKPEAVVIDSRQKQLEYIRSEGLVDPTDATKIEGTPSGLRPGIK
jgi:predicted nucleic acid-binding Zn ribbon protein